MGSAMLHFVNGVTGMDWWAVLLVTSATTGAGALITVLAVEEGPYPFPPGKFEPRRVGQAFPNRGLRLASLGYSGTCGSSTRCGRGSSPSFLTP